jgi:hypothetical protein
MKLTNHISSINNQLFSTFFRSKTEFINRYRIVNDFNINEIFKTIK